MSSPHSGIVEDFSFGPLPGMAGTIAKTLATDFVDDGFLSGFCVVTF